VLLLVDSVEGPMPQTRFVLKKSLALNKKVGSATAQRTVRDFWILAIISFQPRSVFVPSPPVVRLCPT